MGREWLYWVGGGIGRPSTRRRRRTSSAGIKQDESTSAGCMCAVFQLFDMHHHLPLNHQHSLSPFLQEEDTSTTTFKGAEAPRNSLEMETEEPPAATTTKQEEILNFPGGIQIKTKREDFISAESSMDSPGGTKTPNLVARLMGLDLLPESSSNSPSFSCPNSKTPSNNSQTRTRTTSRSRSFYDDDINVGARSLPATPRISSARRSDVEYHHHRLSLQINKENTNEELAKITRPRFRLQQQQDENRSPGHYAKQILKQVKESVSRRVVGQDITNTTTTTTRDEIIRRDQNLLLKLSKKNSTANDTKQSTTSPKLRILDTNTTTNNNKSPRNSTSNSDVAAKPKQQAAIAQQHHPAPHMEINKIEKKLSPKSCDQAIRNKKEDAFVRSPAANKVNLTTDKKKSKKAPLSSELLHLSGPTILPVKKGPSPPATKLPQKQQVSDALSSKRNTQLSSNTSRSYNQPLPLPLQLQLHPDKIFTAPNGCATTSAAADYKCYIHKILKRAGIIDKFTPFTLGKWHTPSHPLDPSIFYYLELFHLAAAPSAAVLSLRCNRKLIFQLVDEILSDKLRPHLDYKPWISPPAAMSADQFGLLDDLCRKIEGFPAVDCQVLEDIDFLIEGDLRKAAMSGYYEEEGERLVREIEGEIVERLVSETVAEGVRTERERRWMSRGEASRDEMP